MERTIKKYIYFPDYRKVLDEIAMHAKAEYWGENKEYLSDLIETNFQVAQIQRKLVENEHCLLRLSNIESPIGETITLFATRNNFENRQKYRFRTLIIGNNIPSRFVISLENCKIPNQISLDQPSHHSNFQLRFNFRHYLIDHPSRFRDLCGSDVTDYMKELLIEAAVTRAHRFAGRAVACQWYCDKNAEKGNFQILLPVSFKSIDPNTKPDRIATLEVNEVEQEYFVRTLLPPEFVYGYARAMSIDNHHIQHWLK